MRIGDKVRMIHDTGEGVIVKFIDQRIAEIELEDGFTIPVAKSELVLIDREESEYFDRKVENDNIPEMPVTSKTRGSQELYAAFVPVTENNLRFYLINDTTEDVLFTFGEEHKNGYKGISHQILPGRKHVLLESYIKSEVNEWPTFLFQFIFHQEGWSVFEKALVKKINWKAKQLFKEKTTVPQLEKEGYSVAIRTDELVINPKEIEESIQRFQEPSPTSFAPKKTGQETEIDLHIEELHDFPEELSNEDIFNIQIRTFESKLDEAVQDGNEGITFIHGVGNGRLKHEIQKMVSGHPHVQYFKDAQKEKFGYGATYVKIK